VLLKRPGRASLAIATIDGVGSLRELVERLAGAVSGANLPRAGSSLALSPQAGGDRRWQDRDPYENRGKEVSTMKILLAYDGFEHSRHALEETAKLAVGGRGQVTVLSVVPPDARGSKSGGHVGLRPHAHEDVARAHEYLRDHGVESEMKIDHGDPVAQIVEELKTGGYDLAVVGSRGRGPVGRLLLGSVSSEVVANAPCPVLVAAEDMTERLEPSRTQ
jgi:nucleotide-binding universal stress UspA family protein